MIELSINEADCKLDAAGGEDKILKEIVCASIVLTERFAELGNIRYETAAFALMSLGKEAYGQAVAEEEKEQAKNE